MGILPLKMHPTCSFLELSGGGFRVTRESQCMRATELDTSPHFTPSSSISSLGPPGSLLCCLLYGSLLYFWHSCFILFGSSSLFISCRCCRSSFLRFRCHVYRPA